MLDMVRNRIGAKLFLLQVTLIMLAMTPFIYMVFSTFSDYGRDAGEAGRDEIRRRAYSYLTTIAREKAHRFDARFSQVESAVSLMATQAGEVYNEIAHYSRLPVDVGDRLLQMQAGLPVYRQRAVSTTFRSQGRLDGGQRRELFALLQLDPVLKGVQDNMPFSVSTHLISSSGICRYFRHELQGFGEMVVEERNPLRYPAILETVSQFSAAGKGVVSTALWTPVYPDKATGSPMRTVLAPVVDRDGRLWATVGVDITLAGGLDQLDVADNLDESWTGEVLFSFLLGENGQLVSFPEQYRPLFGLPPKNDVAVVGEPVNLADSRRRQVALSTDRMESANGETVAIDLDGNTYVLSSHTLHHLGWHLVLVGSGERLSSTVLRTEQALSGTMSALARQFLALGLGLLLVSLVVAYFAVQYFVGPLRRISRSAEQVGRGDLAVRCPEDRTDELGSLAVSFNTMVSRLKEAEDRKRTEARLLERTVMERTRDLHNKNIVLRDVIDELNLESERRRQAVEALEASEKQLRIVMEASVAGHAISQDGRIRYANQMAARIFGYDRDQLVAGDVAMADLMVDDQCRRLQDMVQGCVPGGKEKTLVCKGLRRDGTQFDALVGCAATSWQGGSALVVTVMDISRQKRTEEELLHSKKMLQDSLAEKEVLLREIYHRAKNNMLVIISMLQLQAMEYDDERIRTLFWEMEHRIRAMSLVHEKLYQSQNLTDIDLAQYLKEMVTGLVRSMDIGDKLRVEFTCEPVRLSIDSIIPLGLAVNEIVTNSLKHAFTEGKGGRIYVHLHSRPEGEVEVVVGDDGPGLPLGVEPATARSLGMQITSNLITGQLGGDLEILPESGVVYRLRFTEPTRPRRV